MKKIMMKSTILCKNFQLIFRKSNESDITLKYYEYDSFDKKYAAPFKYSMNNSKKLSSGTIGALDTNLYNSKINIKNLKILNREFDLMGISYYTANYKSDRSTKYFTCAIVQKNTVKANLYQAEIERQNSLKIEVFCKPMLFFYDNKFLYVLYPYLRQKPVQKEKTAIEMYKTIKDLISLYKQLHDKQICFRTLTTSNIFYENNNQNTMKVLRSVNQITSDELNSTKDQKFNKNNVYKILDPQEFNPPEIFERGWCDSKADIWALGTLMFKICNGTLPFNHKNYDFNLHLKPGQMEPFNRYISTDLQILIRKMLEFNPFKRMNIDQILNNEWICQQTEEFMRLDKQYQDEIEGKKNNSSWMMSSISWLKSSTSAIIPAIIPDSQNIGGVGRYLGEKIRDGSNWTRRNFSAPIMKACQKTFQCYGDDDFEESDTRKKVEINRQKLKEKLKNQERDKAIDRRTLMKSVLQTSIVSEPGKTNLSNPLGSDPSKNSNGVRLSNKKILHDSNEFSNTSKTRKNNRSKNYLPR